MLLDRSEPKVSLTPDELASYRELGYTGPFPLLGEREIDAILDEYERNSTLIPWYKGHHVFEGPIVDCLRREALVGRVASILGDDLFVWCSQIMKKGPEGHHRWHVDVETLDWISVNVWIALRNVSVDATVLLLPKTHKLAETPQDLARSEGLDLLDSAGVQRAAKERGYDVEVVRVNARPGEAVIFDGHLWHGSVNTTPNIRTALLTQYSATTQHARRPKTYDPPIQWHEEPPPCLLVRGTDRGGGNRYVVPSAPPRVAALKADARRRLGGVISKVRAALP